MATTRKASPRNKKTRETFGIESKDEVPSRPRARPIVPVRNPLKERYALLQKLPNSTIRKAWFTLAHLLLEPGDTVVDMGCQGGAMAYAMALLSPQSKITGVDISKRMIHQARENYALPNLEFVVGDIGAPDLFKPGSIDAIVNSFILHEVYSGAHYNDRSVVQTLTNQFGLLKPEGTMFIRDFAQPSTGSYVLMEMPNVESTGPLLDNLSEADLLVWYSQHARPRQDPGCKGFFLEELSPRFPKTRLFRLQSKWAYEFIMRKDERDIWEDELDKEYTFFTEREYRKVLRDLGGRVLYTAPHWDDQYVKSCFDGHFRLYEESGTPIGNPPTSFVAVAQKVNERDSLRLNERRPTANPNSKLRIQAMRDDISGRMLDIVSRDVDVTEILPYRVAETGDLHIFVHHGVPRCIVNSVPRNGPDLDGKRWSGHMTEAITIDTETLGSIREDDVSATLKLMKSNFDLRPVAGRTMEKGPAFYPAPDFIDERIETRFIEVEEPNGPINPEFLAADLDGFMARGRIVEMNAQTILNAISVGMIPNAQLELQILALYEKLDMRAEVWADTPLTLPEIDVPKTDVKNLLSKMADKDTRYHSARGTAGHWKPLQSTFVDEGQVNGGLMGLASRDVDFVVSDETTENIAVVLPLVKNLSGEVLAGFVAEYLPVPQRFKGSGFTINAPTLALPKHITSMEAARHYIANHFKVKPENVSKMGESFFCHIGLTPQRIYPFAMTAPAAKSSGPEGMAAYAPIEDLWKLLWGYNSKSFMKIMSLAYKNLGENSDLSVTWDFSNKLSGSHDRPAVTRAVDVRGGVLQNAGMPAHSAEVPDEDDDLDSTDRRKPLLK